jgi:hypothetical protein
LVGLLTGSALWILKLWKALAVEACTALVGANTQKFRNEGANRHGLEVKGRSEVHWEVSVHSVEFWS